MKILQVTTQKPFMTGSGEFLKGLLAAFQGNPQALVCGLAPGEDQDLKAAYPDLRLYAVPFQSAELPFAVVGMSDNMPYEASRYGEISDGEAASLLAAFKKRFVKALEDFQPDLILAHHLYLLTAHLPTWQKETKNEASIIGLCHNSELRQFQQTDRWRQEILDGLKGLSAIASPNQVLKEEVEALYGLANIHILGSGFNYDLFYRPSKRRHKEGPLRIVYTGKLAQAKGIMDLLEALEPLSQKLPLELTLIGGASDPSEEAQIGRLATQVAYPVTLTGLLKAQEVAQRYQDQDIFILPSYFDGMPLVIPEALASGLLVAVTALPGFRQWLEPFADRVAFMDQPEMASLDEPTKEGRKAFKERIGRAIEDLANRQVAEETPDLKDYAWTGLARRLMELGRSLSNH